MKKLDSLKSTTLKSNIIAENKLRDIGGGTVSYTGTDSVSSSGKTYFSGGTVGNNDSATQE